MVAAVSRSRLSAGAQVELRLPPYCVGMVFALLMASAAVNWLPMRWSAADPAALTLLKGGPVNCLLLEAEAASPNVTKRASELGLDALVVAHPGATSKDVEKAKNLNAKGIVFEGKFDKAELSELHKTADGLRLVSIDLPPRVLMTFEAGQTVAGTNQGVWPGIQIEEGGSAKAAPSGAPWINTNSGFLRFVRAEHEMRRSGSA